MSRRDSTSASASSSSSAAATVTTTATNTRASTAGRPQNDALYEFEQFKKKFLLANKHITKLNSTLSVRIEEMNAQIHALNVENLRLRTSELQLASELKREREKSRKIMQDAELATLNLTKHLNYLRTSLEIPRAAPAPRTPPSPKARTRPPPHDASTIDPDYPQGPRVARAPTVPGITEDDEPPPSHNDQDDESAPTSSSSGSTKRKSSVRRRLSASNLPVATSRISTPPPTEPSNLVHMDLSVAVAGSSALGGKRKKVPTRRQSGLLTANTAEGSTTPRAGSPAFGSPVRLAAGRAELQDEMAIAKALVDAEEDEDEEERGKAMKRRARNRLESTPMPASKERKRRRDPADDDDFRISPHVEAITAVAKSSKASSSSSSRAALQPIDNTIRDAFDDLVSQGKQFLAAQHQHRERETSPVILSAGSTTNSDLGEGGADGGGRESRRARKSVNYAEPKLNTKMRRPEGVQGLGAEPRKKRASSAAALGGTRTARDLDTENPQYRDTPEPPEPHDADSAGVTVAPRRRKSRPQMYEDEAEQQQSDGAEGDEEYAPPGSTSKKSWGNINIDGRRRMPGRSRTPGEGESTGSGRRHSMAV